MARIGLFLVPDPDNPENGRVLVNHKNNLAAKAIHLRFTIEQNQDEIGYVEWNGESTYSEQELLNQWTPTDNRKSEQETGLIEVLKKNGIAMNTADIHKELETGQSIDALEKMLERKVKQGILIRPSRGLYTYQGNPLYIAKTKSDTDVGNVGNVEMSVMSEIESDILPTMSESKDGYRPSSEGVLQQTDISDIDSYVGNNIEEFDL